MADENNIQNEAAQQSQEATTTTTTVEAPNPFDEGSWNTQQQNQETQQQPTQTEKKEEEVIVDDVVYLKEQLGYDSWETAKNELAELRKLKDAPPQQTEFKFANEDSEKFFAFLKDGKSEDVYNFLHNKKQIERVSALDPNEIGSAAEIIKTNLKYKYKDLSADEINDLFEEEYQKSPKPSQKTDELDEEYNERLQQWEKQSYSIDKKIVRDAKIAKPELVKYNNEIVLPDIPKNESQTNKQPSQEDLAAFEKVKTSFLQVAQGSIDGFNGFSVSVKDKDVDIPVSYGVSQEEKGFVQKLVNDFATSGFDANVLLAERWVKEDKTINTDQMVKDLSLVFNGEKVFQKLVNDAAAKRLDAYLKDKKNINLSGGQNQDNFALDERTENQKLAEWVFSV